ncbi:hypothetical protein DHEL01_v206027 [Diaporthe helianthi]|uniref:Uncharacterized protein n=1 Tax=Diaporthe helianthi TaxID=158607 RepID=A0A2P5HZ99_DIAHE|nr:hypothetical protein DHEL01_v206027 [Diaporthe helianthi]
MLYQGENAAEQEAFFLEQNQVYLDEPGKETLSGSRVGSGGAQWTGWRLPHRSPPVFDDLVLEVPRIRIEEGRIAPSASTNLAIRTAKPPKRRRDDTEETGADKSDDAPLSKEAKILQS